MSGDDLIEEGGREGMCGDGRRSRDNTMLLPCRLSMSSSFCFHIIPFMVSSLCPPSASSLVYLRGASVNYCVHPPPLTPPPPSLYTFVFRGLHFLAVQPDPDSEELNGLWLLMDRTPPNV